MKACLRKETAKKKPIQCALCITMYVLLSARQCVTLWTGNGIASVPVLEYLRGYLMIHHPAVLSQGSGERNRALHYRSRCEKNGLKRFLLYRQQNTTYTPGVKSQASHRKEGDLKARYNVILFGHVDIMVPFVFIIHCFISFACALAINIAVRHKC